MDIEQDYTNVGLVIRRDGNKYALYRVFLSDAGQVLREELVIDNSSLPRVTRTGRDEMDMILHRLNRHVYSLPEYIGHNLKIG